MNIEQITGACGAEISGVNLARLSNSEFDSINTALLDHGVLFFAIRIFRSMSRWPLPDVSDRLKCIRLSMA